MTRPGTQTEVANEFGVDRSMISRMIKEKDPRIQYTPGGKLDVDGTVDVLRRTDFGKPGKSIPARSGAA